MKKLVFMALAIVFLWCSGFTHKSESDFLQCQCACTETIVFYYAGMWHQFEFTSYVTGEQACNHFSNGNGDYDDSNCINVAGVLNATSVEDLKAAESGEGC